MKTVLQKFLFDGLPVRGAIVRVEDGWQQLLQRRQLHHDTAYPPPVQALLGEMVAASALMQSNIKFDGALVLQIMGDGPVKVAVAEMFSDYRFRATANVQGQVADDAPLSHMVNVLNQGRCAITLDPENKKPGQQPYQGIVPLYGDQREKLEKLSDVLSHYMLQSEQLDTAMVLAADDNVAAGIFVQRMPLEGEGNLENLKEHEGEDDALADYERIAAFVHSVKREELLSLNVQDMLHRLFWEEPLMQFEAIEGEDAPRFSCSCSEEKVRNMIATLGKEQAEDIVQEQGSISVDCQFCGARYVFDDDAVAQIFPPEAHRPPGSSRVN